MNIYYDVYAADLMPAILYVASNDVNRKQAKAPWSKSAERIQETDRIDSKAACAQTTMSLPSTTISALFFLRGALFFFDLSNRLAVALPSLKSLLEQGDYLAEDFFGKSQFHQCGVDQMRNLVGVSSGQILRPDFR